jgi:hypothetical protein
MSFVSCGVPTTSLCHNAVLILEGVKAYAETIRIKQIKMIQSILESADEILNCVRHLPARTLVGLVPYLRFCVLLLALHTGANTEDSAIRGSAALKACLYL